MPQIADRLNDIKVSASTVMSGKARELAARGIKVIALTVGEPDFATPAHAIAAAHQAALDGDTKYPAQDGSPALKAAVPQPSAQVASPPPPAPGPASSAPAAPAPVSPGAPVDGSPAAP